MKKIIIMTSIVLFSFNLWSKEAIPYEMKDCSDRITQSIAESASEYINYFIERIEGAKSATIGLCYPYWAADLGGGSTTGSTPPPDKCGVVVNFESKRDAVRFAKYALILGDARYSEHWEGNMIYHANVQICGKY